MDSVVHDGRADSESVPERNLEIENASYYLSSEGPFAKKSENYEERPCQIELAEKIAESFNDGLIGVFEAGTGVGKSFAYLIPSILWASRNREKIVVSTGTINLQQQIFEKDIPFAQQITGIKVKSVLIKGRQNYVCLRKMHEAEFEQDLFSEDAESLKAIGEWAEKTKNGNRSELSFMPSEQVWARICSESDGCMGGRCEYREECFIMKLRKEANDSDIIVVNHHLLFADIESRMNGAGYDDAVVLPPFKRLVLDEAHGIEDSATSFFSESFTRFKLMKQVGLLFRSWKKTHAGFLVQAAVFSDCDDFMEKTAEAVENIKNALLYLDQVAMLHLGDSQTARINDSNSESFSEVLDGIAKLKVSVAVFSDLVKEVLEHIDEEDEDVPCAWECKTVLHRLESYAVLCTNFCHWDEHPETVFWMQKVKIPPKNPGEEFLVFVQFVQTPLDIAPMMNRGVFEPLETVICTSATLRIENSFDYWLRRVGISFVPKERVSLASYDSPFPYRKNVLFAVPSDAPFPDSQYFQSYVEETVPKLIIATKGRALVLFTSYESLKYTYRSCEAMLSSHGITLYRQGDDDRFRLLESFKKDVHSVLFATDSFWEGVDVPGDSLCNVIIVKLPFSVPNDPVFASRAEDLEKKGLSSFMQLSVPLAVVKFRQGFGRLIRRGDDRGVIVVLDRRIVEKQYGKMFTKSVPMTRRMYNSLEYIISEIGKFV